MTDYPGTETVARILARGYNQHIQDHGPDSSAAGEVAQTADGHGLLVVRDGAEYAVRVTRAQADRWSALRANLTQDAATDQELGDDYAEMGTGEALDTAHQHWGRAKVLREVLAWMDREDGS